MMMTMMRCNATYVLVLLMATAGATAARSEVEHDIIENEEYEQFGCTSYYNTGASVRPPNTKYDDDGAGFTAETCDQACKDQGYSFFGFECPMTNEVHCQCYTAQSVGEDKPLERANCKAEVGRDGDKHCTGPAMINGISLGGADIGSIYKVTTFAIANQEETDCLEVPPEPILQETIGSVLNSNAFLDDAVQIVGSGFDSDNDVDYVAFTVNQLWNKEGLPMIAVSYAEGNQGEMVCDMQTSSSLGLIEFESVTKYSAQCAHGYAEISVYLYVGDSDDFNIEECESCAAPDNNYVGYYLLLPCDHICEEVETRPPRTISTPVPTKKPTNPPTAPPTKGPTLEPTEPPTAAPTVNPTASPTASPTKEPTLEPTEPPTGAPTVNPTVSPTASPTTFAPTVSPTLRPTAPPIDAPTFIACPSDIKLKSTVGITEYPSGSDGFIGAVSIVSQDTSTVTVDLMQAWQLPVENYFYEYKEDLFNLKCYEQDNVIQGELIDTVTIQCNWMSPIAYLNICLQDNIRNELLSIEDNGTVPKCCHSSAPEDTPTVCYKLEISCEMGCVPTTKEDFGRPNLRSSLIDG